MPLSRGCKHGEFMPHEGHIGLTFVARRAGSASMGCDRPQIKRACARLDEGNGHSF